MRVVKFVGAFLVLIGFSLPAAAQRVQAQQEQAQGQTQTAGQGQTTKVIPAISTAVYDRLNEAQVCMDEDDLECAEQILNRMENNMRNLNNYEIAQLWNFRAFLFFDQDNAEGAINAYETILGLPFEDMPDGMIQGTMRNLATLYVQEEQYQRGLDTFMRWMELPTVTPSPDDYYLLATIDYQMERYADGIPAIQEAIRLANAQGDIGDEQWYQMLYVFYFQLEQTDKVIETLTFMVEHWTKRDWVIQLAGQLSGQDRETETLVLYEAAYDAGWLTRGTEWVQLANFYLNARAPYKAAVLLEKGLSDDTIESTPQNWRLLSQAWQLAGEHQKAVPALERASSLADDGDIDRLLAQSFVRLARWQDCADASRRSIDRGGVDRTDLVYMMLGQCLMNLKEYEEARNAFRQAARDDRVASNARQFIQYNDELLARERTNQEALRALQAN
jgi:tetratricopeptide (TPR) repeat protein